MLQKNTFRCCKLPSWIQKPKVRSISWYILQDWCRKSKTFTRASDLMMLSLCIAPFKNWKDVHISIFRSIFYTCLFCKHLFFWLMYDYAWCNVNIIHHLKYVLYHTLYPPPMTEICSVQQSVFGECTVYLIFHKFRRHFIQSKRSIPKIPFRC